MDRGPVVHSPRIPPTPCYPLRTPHRRRRARTIARNAAAAPSRFFPGVGVWMSGEGHLHQPRHIASREPLSRTLCIASSVPLHRGGRGHALITAFPAAMHLNSPPPSPPPFHPRPYCHHPHHHRPRHRRIRHRRAPARGCTISPRASVCKLCVRDSLGGGVRF